MPSSVPLGPGRLGMCLTYMILVGLAGGDILRQTHDVWVSLDPENMTTSAGDVLVRIVRSRAEFPIVAFLKKPIAVDATPDRSPFPYELIALNRSRAASLPRLGSLRMP